MNDCSNGSRGGKWSVPEMVNWIAFGTEPEQSPATMIANVGTGRFLSPEIMDALKARAAGNPRSWPTKGAVLDYPMWPVEKFWPQDIRSGFPAWCYRASVRKWMRETGLTASELEGHAQAERTRYVAELKGQDAQQAALAVALDKLNAAAGSSKFVLRGRPSKSGEPPRSPPLRQPIPPEYFDDPRGINFDGTFSIRYDRTGWDWLHDPGPFFYDCQGDAAEVRRVFGSGPAMEGIAPSPVGRPPIGRKMRAALEALLAAGQIFETPKDAHRATLDALGVRDRRHGFSLRTFKDHCTDLL